MAPGHRYGYAVRAHKMGQEQPVDVAFYDDALEAWWGYVEYLSTHGCLAGAVRMDQLSSAFDRGESIRCNGVELQVLTTGS